MDMELLGNVYCHINNGGISVIIGIDNDNQPVLKITATHFGNITNWMEISVSEERIHAIRDLFDIACEHKFEGGVTGAMAHKS